MYTWCCRHGGASLLLHQSDMNHHPKLLLLYVRELSTYNSDKVSIDEHVTMLLKSGECAVSVIIRQHGSAVYAGMVVVVCIP